MSKFTEAKIISNEPLTGDIYLISIAVSTSSQKPKPGQFYILKLNQRFDPLLGRPFSIFDYEDNTVKFLYRVKGRGTTILSQTEKGEKVFLTGPLGRNYPVPSGDFVVIAGGIGIASVYYLIKQFPKRAYLFYGVRNKEEVLFHESLLQLAKEVCISTECGSLGYQGVVTEVFKEHGLKLNLPVYACGPMIMIKELKKILKDKSIPCYVAVEERMACGIGACLGCVIETEEGLKRVCTDGPVFDLGMLKF